MTLSLAKPPNIFAVVLAAGTATRFGSTKQTAMVGCESLVRRASELACGACGNRTLLVAGHDLAAVVRSAERQCRFVAVNDRFQDGIGTSIALAASCLSHAADAILLLLADQALITPRHVQELLQKWTGRDTHIVATAFADSLGPPVLLPRATFARLAALSGDHGAKSLFEDDCFELSAITFEDARIDVDTLGDLEYVIQRLV